MAERGEIRNREQALQIKDFRRLIWGNITPTDIDCPEIPFFIDFQNRLFVFCELKHGDSKLTVGQRLAFERICDACQRGGVPTYYLVARHDSSGDIEVADAVVTEYRHDMKWNIPLRSLTVKTAVDILRSKHIRGTNG